MILAILELKKALSFRSTPCFCFSILVAGAGFEPAAFRL